jgi:hypothetical protein
VQYKKTRHKNQKYRILKGGITMGSKGRKNVKKAKKAKEPKGTQQAATKK